MEYTKLTLNKLIVFGHRSENITDLFLLIPKSKKKFHDLFIFFRL